MPANFLLRSCQRWKCGPLCYLQTAPNTVLFWTTALAIPFHRQLVDPIRFQSLLFATSHAHPGVMKLESWVRCIPIRCDAVTRGRLHRGVAARRDYAPPFRHTFRYGQVRTWLHYVASHLLRICYLNNCRAQFDTRVMYNTGKDRMQFRMGSRMRVSINPNGPRRQQRQTGGPSRHAQL